MVFITDNVCAARLFHRHRVVNTVIAIFHCTHYCKQKVLKRTTRGGLCPPNRPKDGICFRTKLTVSSPLGSFVHGYIRVVTCTAKTIVRGVNTGGAKSELGTEMKRQVGQKMKESALHGELQWVALLRLLSGAVNSRTFALTPSLRWTRAPAVAFHRQPFHCGSQ